jgi:hypothetical protein
VIVFAPRLATTFVPAKPDYFNSGSSHGFAHASSRRRKKPHKILQIRARKMAVTVENPPG